MMRNHERTSQLHRAALMVLVLGLALGEGLAFLGLGLVILACVYRRHETFGQILGSRMLLVWLLGWTAWLIVGLVMIAVSGEGALKPSELTRHVSLLATPAVFVSVRSLPESTAHDVAKWLLGALFISALFGLYQWWASDQPLTYLVRADSSIATQSKIPGDPSAHAATGFFFHRLKMAHVICLAFGATLCFILTAAKHRLAGIILLMGFGLCLLGTYAKAAIVATAAGGSLVVFLMVSTAHRRILLGSGMVLSALIFFSNWDLAPLLERSFSAREFIWTQAMNIIQDYPGGVGLGNYSQVVGRYYDLVMPAFHIRTYPHHLLLSWWVECGFVGMAAAGGAWIYVGLQSLRGAWSMNTSAEQKGLHAALCFSLVTFWFIGMTHDVLYHPSVALMFFSVIGWLLGRLSTGELKEIE